MCFFIKFVANWLTITPFQLFMRKFATVFMMVAVLAATASCSSEPQLTPSQVGSKWGYVNPKGELVIEPAFEAAENFHCQLAKVVLNGKTGYIGADGLFRITADYLEGTSFFEDKAYVVGPGETPRCIDKTGRIIFQLPEDIRVAHVFSGDISKVESYNSSVRYVDKAGNAVATPTVYQIDAAPGFTTSIRSDAYYAPEFKTTMHAAYGETYDLGLSAASTLGDVRNKFTSSQGASNNKLTHKPAVTTSLNGVTLNNIQFGFDGPVMGTAGGGRNMGYFGKYKTAATAAFVTSRSLMNAEYHFTLSDQDKGPAFVRTLAKELSDKTGELISGVGNNYTIALSASHPGYNLSWTGAEAILRVIYAE